MNDAGICEQCGYSILSDEESHTLIMSLPPGLRFNCTKCGQVVPPFRFTSDSLERSDRSGAVKSLCEKVSADE